MNQYRYGILLNALLLTGMISAANLSCNERMRHGPKALVKGAFALVGGAATLYMVSELKDTLGPLRVPAAHVHANKRQEALQNSLFTACALVALGYVTWKFGTSSLESFKIYLDNRQDLQIGVQKVLEETETQQPATIEETP